MTPRSTQPTLRSPPVETGAVSGLAALAFGNASALAGEAKHLAFLPLDSLELDISDPEQCDFGDYELLEQLGQGGMGVVYRAWQRSLEREVALKLLSAGPWASPEFVSRFKREAQSAARLQHPNIVAIYEIGQHAELNFFSMALVRGRNLEQHLDQSGPMPSREAARLVRAVAEALDYAHRLGILHLDLKPANVLVDEHNEPQVADFGLARRLDETLASDGTQISGTPSYMAPEQAQAKHRRIGVATDIYGIGAILYELLCGRPPFLGATPRQTLEQVIEQEIEPLHRRNRDVPEDLDAICLHCLAKDPDSRYVTARGLAEDLGRFLEGRAVSVRPLTRWQRIRRWARREPRVALAAASAIFALFSGLAATTVQWRRAELQSQRAEAATTQVRDNLWQTRLDEGGRFIRAGQLTAALPGLLRNLEDQSEAGESALAANTRLRIGSVLAEIPRPIERFVLGTGATNLVLDPAGGWVAVGLDDGRAKLFDLAEGQLRWTRTFDPRFGAVLQPVPDSRWLLSLNGPRRGYGASLNDLASGEESTAPAPLFGLFGAEISMDGRFALVGETPAVNGDPQMRVVRTSDWSPLGPRIKRLPGLIMLAPGGAHFAHYLRDPQNATSTASAGSCANDTVCVSDTRSERIRWSFRHARGTPMQDWLFAPDGAWLLLSFGNGDVIEMSMADGTIRHLQPQPAAAAAILAYDSEGRWLGASYGDGTVQVWDRGDYKLVAPPIHLEARGDAASIALFAEQHLLATSVDDNDQLWLLPGDGRAARAIVKRPALARPVATSAAAFAPSKNLMAAAASDGELRIWRYRERERLPIGMPRQAMPGGERRVDPGYVLDVRGATLQRRRLSDGEAAGTPLQLPQAPGFAQLLPDSPWIVANAGRTLHVLHGIDGRQRYPPIELPATPSALLLQAEGRRGLVAWQGRDGDHHQLVLRSVDLEHGKLLAELPLPGSIWNLDLADAGDCVLAWRYGEMHVLDADTLVPRFPALRFGSDIAALYQENLDKRGDELIWQLSDIATRETMTLIAQARIDASSRVLWLSTNNRGNHENRLHAFDAGTGQQRQLWTLPGRSGALQPFDDDRALAMVLPQQQELHLYRLNGETRVIKLAGVDRWNEPSMALSSDQKRLAVALVNGVQWFDLEEGSWLSAPMQLPVSASRHIAGIGIDAAGEHALLRDDEDHRWHVALPGENRSLAELGNEIGLLAPDHSRPDAAPEPSGSHLRQTLRNADPGPPGRVPSLPEPIATMPLSTDPRHVDLGPRCNLQLAEQKRAGLRLLPPGLHRLLGVDYLVGCAVILHQAWAGEPRVTDGSRTDDIESRLPLVDAIDLLMLGANRLKGEAREAYATFEWIYADGSRVRVPLINRDQIQFSLNPFLAADASPLRIAWIDLGKLDGGSGLVTWASATYASRIENPQPRHVVRAFALESVPAPWSTPVLLAATLVPSATTHPGATALPASSRPGPG
jgi:hypothetical protein